MRGAPFSRLIISFVVLVRVTIGKEELMRVISDIHAGSCWANQGPLFDFLDWTAREGNVDTLVLNGDIFDFWLFPINEPASSLEQLVSGGLNASIFDVERFRKLLKKAARSVHMVHEGPGNHDMWMTDELVQEVLGIRSAKIQNTIKFQDCGVAFEHGHRSTIFNQEPPGPNPKKMAIGYYIARAAATWACQGQESMSNFLADLINDVLGTRVINDATVEVLRQPYIFKKLLKNVLERASDGHLSGKFDTPIMGVVKPDTCPLPGDRSTNYTYAHMIQDYSNVLNDFVKEFGLSKTAKYIMADVVPGALDKEAAAECCTDESMLVLGHTHIPRLQIVARNSPGVSVAPDILVANAGAWVADEFGKKHQSYLDIVIDDIKDDYPECYTNRNGSDYRGRKSHAANNDPCIAWGSHSKYGKAFGKVAYCRNLGEWGVPWCWTGEFSWRNCSVGEPKAQCPTIYTRGAVKVDLIRYGEKLPLAHAWRKNSTGSRWTVNVNNNDLNAPTENRLSQSQDKLLI